LVVADLAPETLIRFIVSDFEGAWDAVASFQGERGRGNFMFARQATLLLEVACRLCRSDATGSALSDFGKALHAREPRYFAQMPGPCWSPSKRTTDSFVLPSVGGDPTCHVLAAAFHLIRNGQSHQNQQMRAYLRDGRWVCFDLTGAAHNRVLGADRQGHLTFRNQTDGIWIRLLTDVFFMDLRDAVKESKIVDRSLQFAHLTEKGRAAFTFDSSAFLEALRKGGLVEDAG
jgi:hypothetical protein